MKQEGWDAGRLEALETRVGSIDSEVARIIRERRDERRAADAAPAAAADEAHDRIHLVEQHTEINKLGFDARLRHVERRVEDYFRVLTEHVNRIDKRLDELDPGASPDPDPVGDVFRSAADSVGGAAADRAGAPFPYAGGKKPVAEVLRAAKSKVVQDDINDSVERRMVAVHKRIEDVEGKVDHAHHRISDVRDMVAGKAKGAVKSAADKFVEELDEVGARIPYPHNAVAGKVREAADRLHERLDLRLQNIGHDIKDHVNKVLAPLIDAHHRREARERRERAEIQAAFDTAKSGMTGKTMKIE